MNSGVLALLLHRLPYQLTGLVVISTVFYILDLFLFVFFSTLFVIRFVVHGADAYAEIIRSQADLMLCACGPIAFMTLTSLTSLICSNSRWGGFAFTLVAYVMWWFVALWSVAFLFWIFIILFQKHSSATGRLPTTIIIPAVSVSTAAVTGGVVVSISV